MIKKLYNRFFSNNHGLTIVESLIALAITAGIVMTLVKVLDINVSLQKRVEKLHSVSGLKRDITFNIGNNFYCTETVLGGNGTFKYTSQSIEVEKVVGGSPESTLRKGKNASFPTLEIEKMTFIPHRVTSKGLWANFEVRVKDLPSKSDSTFNIPVYVMFDDDLNFQTCFAANTDISASFIACRDFFHGEWGNEGINLPFCHNLLYDKDPIDQDSSVAKGGRVKEILEFLNHETEKTLDRARKNRSVGIAANAASITSLKARIDKNTEDANRVERELRYYGEMYLHSRGR